MGRYGRWLRRRHGCIKVRGVQRSVGRSGWDSKDSCHLGLEIDWLDRCLAHYVLSVELVQEGVNILIPFPPLEVRWFIFVSFGNDVNG